MVGLAGLITYTVSVAVYVVLSLTWTTRILLFEGTSLCLKVRLAGLITSTVSVAVYVVLSLVWTTLILLCGEFGWRVMRVYGWLIDLVVGFEATTMDTAGSTVHLTADLAPREAEIVG
jgi:hypothetical protein